MPPKPPGHPLLPHISPSCENSSRLILVTFQGFILPFLTHPLLARIWVPSLLLTPRLKPRGASSSSILRHVARRASLRLRRKRGGGKIKGKNKQKRGGEGKKGRGGKEGKKGGGDHKAPRIHMYICVHVHIYIYIYTFTHLFYAQTQALKENFMRAQLKLKHSEEGEIGSWSRMGEPGAQLSPISPSECCSSSLKP